MNYAVTRDPVPRSRKLVHYNIPLTNNHIKSAYCQNCQVIVKLIVDFKLQLACSQLQLQLGKNSLPN